MDDPVELKLSAARTRLILDKPFLGALVLRLPMVEADPNWCRTTATDARTFYYNREFIDVLSLDHVQFMLAQSVGNQADCQRAGQFLVRQYGDSHVLRGLAC